MTASSLSPTPRLTLADYAEILAVGTKAAWHVNPFTWLLRDKAEADLFNCGANVDDDGRQLACHLIQIGHPLVVAMRAAIQVETESISVIAPAEGWRP